MFSGGTLSGSLERFNQTFVGKLVPIVEVEVVGNHFKSWGNGCFPVMTDRGLTCSNRVPGVGRAYRCGPLFCPMFTSRGLDPKGPWVWGVG